VGGHVDGGHGGLCAEPQVSDLPLAGRKFIGAGDEATVETATVGVFHLASDVSSFGVDFGTDSVTTEQSSHLEVV